MISNVLRSMIIGLLIFSLVKAQETQGTPGVDYPNFVTVPNSSFKCSDQEFIPGFYADLETQCQAYHYCSEEGQETFLCPVGSIFNQAKLACDAWYNFNCTIAPQSYIANSGFLLESAMKNVPLLIKLRNRAQNRGSFRIPTTSVYEKITSLHDGAELHQSSTERSSESNDNAELNHKSQEEMLNEGESLDDILSRLESSVQNDELNDGMYGDSGDENASENLQTNLFFDPVTEQYFVDPDSSQNEWTQSFDGNQFAFHDRENFAYKYGLAIQDAGESKNFEYVSEPTGLYGLDEMNNEENQYDQFFKRQMDMEQPLRRLRRKPIYTVIRDEDELPIDMADDMDSVMDSEGSFSTEAVSAVTDANSQPSAEINSENVGVPNTMAPFDMVEDISRMHMTPLNITEVPMTSEEFEDAIISELIVPKLEEHDLRILGSTSDQEQSNDGNADDTSSNIQNDGFYSYVENASPEQVWYSNEYDVENDAANQDMESERSEEIYDATEYYPNDETVGDSEKSDNTFVVIPDESEIAEFSEAFDASANSAASTYQDLSPQSVNGNDAVRDSMNFNIPNSYESQDVYPGADPSLYHTSRYSRSVEYSPGQYFQDGYFDPENVEPSSYNYAEESYVSDDPQAMGPEFHHYGQEANDPTNQFMYASPSYACQQLGYGNCMYSPQPGYPYVGYNDNPYVSFPYASNVEESSESPIYVDGSDSSGSSSYMMPDYSNVNEQFESNSENENPYFYQDQNFAQNEYAESPSDNSGAVLKDENEDQETYYVLEDDDGRTTSEGYPEIVSETSEDNVNTVLSDVTGNKEETYYILDDEDEEKVMKDDPELETSSDATENEEILKQHISSQEKRLSLEEPSMKDSSDLMSSLKTDSKDVSLSEENSALDRGKAESRFGSTMDSRFTHATMGGPFTTESDHQDIFDSSERSIRNDEASKVFVSSHAGLPNMFLNNMGYSDPINFGPHGFGSNLGQTIVGGSPTAFSFANGQKHEDSESPSVSKLSALQERIRSLKQGKFGAFKKYVSSSGSKN